MAGIGFQLKKLMDNKEGFFGRMSAYSHSSLVVTGPVILCIIQLLTGLYFLNISGAPFFERELLISGSMYGFVFSQLISGGFIMVITRYVADQIYNHEEQNILPSLYGVMAVMLAIGGAIGFSFYLFSPLNLLFKVTGYVFLAELLVIHILTMYISSVNKYLDVVKSYFIGILSSMMAMGICFLLFQKLMAVYLLASMAIGFLITILLLMKSLKNRFQFSNQNYFGFLPYIIQYPSLFLIGLLYTLGLFGHIFIFWGSDSRIIIGDTFAMAPFYDVPIFYAYLTILPAMIKFVVSVETSFYQKYKKYYGEVLGTSSIQEITTAKADMFYVLKRELIYIMEIQLFVTILAIPLGITLLPLSTEQLSIYHIVVIGSYFFIMMFVIVQILLYFDDRKGALLVLMSYLAVVLPVTTITILYGGYYGFACFIAGITGFLIALTRLSYLGGHLEYYTYRIQVTNPRGQNLMEKLAYRLNEWNCTAREKARR